MFLLLSCVGKGKGGREGGRTRRRCGRKTVQTKKEEYPWYTFVDLVSYLVGKLVSKRSAIRSRTRTPPPADVQVLFLFIFFLFFFFVCIKDEQNTHRE
jgi:hypothetical protein